MRDASDTQLFSRILFGASYYLEYLPYDRLDADIVMMKDCGINVVRIGESTWSTYEPQPGVFCFETVDRVLEEMHAAGISVIVGTPTYAIPSWLVRLHPEVMAVTKEGVRPYGARQLMDLTSPPYLFHAERIIRKLIGHVRSHPAVIGYQLDNETKHYDTAGSNVQQRFVRYLKDKFKTTDAINRAWGLDYWSNRIDSWEDVPSTVGTINPSMGAEFARFQKLLVTEFLTWQAQIVRELARPDQFLTHNFDLTFNHGGSFGLQVDVDHFKASAAVDIAGTDIYHPTQEDLDGATIAFGGDLSRSLKAGANYLVLETQAQGWLNWLPFPGQLRLQAYAHLASGAAMVAYWHWHCLHNGPETYWRGLVSHDFSPNPTYQEACVIGAEFRKLSARLSGMRKRNDIAILVSNDALEALRWLRVPGFSYNDILRQMYDALYRMNAEVDILSPGVSMETLSAYRLVLVPSLYAAPDHLLRGLAEYVQAGGHAIFTCRSGVADEHSKVRTSLQPGILFEVCGVCYHEHTIPKSFGLRGNPFDVPEAHNRVSGWMELLIAQRAEVLAYYDHPVWGKYAAITRNTAGRGVATYVGAGISSELMSKLLMRAVKDAGLWGSDQQSGFPLVIRKGCNSHGNELRFYMNYSDTSVSRVYEHASGVELIRGRQVRKGEVLHLGPWDVLIIEANANFMPDAATSEN